jgi:hypothetical protein
MNLILSGLLGMKEIKGLNSISNLFASLDSKLVTKFFVEPI